MDLFDGGNIALKLFVEFLSEEKEHHSLAPDDWGHFEKSFGERIYADVLYLMIQKEFNPKEAREHWGKIIDHRRSIHETLGRDVGLQVAVCDYFTNIHPILNSLVLVEIHQLVQKERSALLDHLTGLYNRRFLDRLLKKELEYAKRFEQPFSILMCLVDNFHDYCALYGNEAGDRVLAELAEILSKTARTMDHGVRYSAEEFVVILPRCKKEHAELAAERHRCNVELHDFPGEESLPSGKLTMTIGVSTFPGDTEDAKELLQLAEEAMRQGKESGRNRVVSWEWGKPLLAPLVKPS